MTNEEMVALRNMLREDIREIVREELSPVNARLDKLEETVAEVKEDTEVTRFAVNSLIEWADSVSVVVKVPYPIERID